MQGLADGYFIAPYTVGHHLASRTLKPVTDAHPKFKETMIDARSRVEKILAVNGSTTVTELHRRLGQIMWNKCGMARNEAGLNQGIEQVRVPGSGEELNQNLEHAGRLADFLEFGELLARDALHRQESCGGHFREEYQTPEGEALRDDANFCYAGAWEFHGDDMAQSTLHKEPLEFHDVPLVQRSYK
jgi:succinate dehydrogenase / fumarate reductase flavoprotein subunit